MTTNQPGPSSCIPAGGHVLVVDDDPEIQAAIQMTLELEGYNVATAGDGRQALDRIAERLPDIVLLDLAMPVMTGWELHQHLRERGLDIPLVYMTAALCAPIEARTHHAAGYLAKPFAMDHLLEFVERYAP